MSYLLILRQEDGERRASADAARTPGFMDIAGATRIASRHA